MVSYFIFFYHLTFVFLSVDTVYADVLIPFSYATSTVYKQDVQISPQYPESIIRIEVIRQQTHCSFPCIIKDLKKNRIMIIKENVIHNLLPGVIRQIYISYRFVSVK